MVMDSLNRRFRRIILASSSPRRADLLRQIGLRFEIHPSHIDETVPSHLTPAEAVRWASHAKAHAVAAEVPSGLIIAADTLVLYRGQQFGKPKSLDEARRMLSQLSGQCHEVLTGVTLLHLETAHERGWTTCTRVQFRCLAPEEIEEYIISEPVLDKAGAYGIQGQAGAFVERIEGCYFNVVGLPLADLVEHLRSFPLERTP